MLENESSAVKQLVAEKMADTETSKIEESAINSAIEEEEFTNKVNYPSLKKGACNRGRTGYGFSS